MIELLYELIEHFLVHITHRILLLRILANLCNPGSAGLHIVLANTLTGSCIKLLQVVVVQNHLVAPCPTVVTVVIVDLREAIKHLLDIVDGTALDVFNESLLLTLRQQQSTHVNPLTLSHSAHRLADIALLLGTLQHSTHINTQGDIVVLLTLTKRRGIDHILVEVIGRHVVTRGITQGLQDLDSLHDLSHGEGREPVEVNDTLLRLLTALVALGPFLDITIQTNSGDVTSWHQIAVIAISHQIAERQIARIRMVHQLSEANAERANSGRHQHIRARGSLSTTLQSTIVQRTHLIGVVREVGVRACVIERELTTNQQ